MIDAANTVVHVIYLTFAFQLAFDRVTRVVLVSALQVEEHIGRAVQDLAGNPITAKTWTFTTGPAPVVTSRTPAANATGISRTANITATFSEAVTGLPNTAAASGNFIIRRASNGATFSSTVTYSSTANVATLNPTGTLLANTRYTVTLRSGIKDLAGNPLAPVTWSFTTGN